MELHKLMLSLERVARSLSETVYGFSDQSTTNDITKARLIPVYGSEFQLTLRDEDGEEIRSVRIPQEEIVYIIENNFDYNRFITWFCAKEYHEETVRRAKRIMSAVQTIKNSKFSDSEILKLFTTKNLCVDLILNKLKEV